MEEKKNLTNKGCGHDCGHKSLLCWSIGFVVLVIVFCTGFKLGELKSYFRNFYEQDGYGYDYQTRGMMRYQNGGYGMMRGWRNTGYYAPSEQVLPETTTTTTSSEK